MQTLIYDPTLILVLLKLACRLWLTSESDSVSYPHLPFATQLSRDELE